MINLSKKISHGKNIIFVSVAAAALLAVPLGGCSSSSGTILSDPIVVSDFKLDTYVSVSVYDNVDKSIADNALALCDKYEDIFSMQKKGSVLWNVNNNKTTTIPADLGKAIKKGLEMSALSDGAFEISIGSVSSLWDFTSGKNTVPSDKDIKAALRYVDDSKISVTPVDSNNEDGDWTIKKPEKTVIDLGAVSKGYIADRIKEYLKANSVEHAVINLGGNVLCVGEKGNAPFQIGIQKPFASSGETSTVLSLNNMSSVSSGIYERYFKGNDGKLYHHILNPSTGYPYENNLYQVTIISDDSLTGDCLSTVCFALGLDKGMALIENTKNVEAIFTTNDQVLHYSSGAQKYES